MKSKSVNLGHTSADTLKQNRTFDFVNLYKSTSETNVSFNTKPQTIDAYDTTSPKVKSESPKRERSPNKRKRINKRESVDVSHIANSSRQDSSNVDRSVSMNESKVTSTPLVKHKLQSKSSKVKSIMKNSSAITDVTMDDSNLDSSSSNPKKRNKSVSFMLGDNEEVVIKKIKSDESTNECLNETTSKIKVKRHFKKTKKDRLAGKENKTDINKPHMETGESNTEKIQQKSKSKQNKPKTLDETLDVVTDNDGQANKNENVIETKKKHKRAKKVKKPEEATESKVNMDTENTVQEVPDKIKKPKKKKHQEKPTEPENEEPASKSRKKDMKPDVVTELENLSIGDNPHTLSNMLDEMTVVDKDKRKKLKRKFNKNKKDKGAKEDIIDPEKTDDVQEKVKWSRRKWNKDPKADIKEASLDTTIIVDNLPLSMLFSYKKTLAEHFLKYGLIRSVGIAEVYPTEVSQPVFTTTVMFYSDGAANQALEDKTLFDGVRVRVRRPLPPTETTLVVRSYGALTAQTVTTMFSGAGRLRNIRPSVKGKHSMSTFFVELDGPESVERAVKLVTDARASGKKVYVSRFELRTKKNKQKAKDNDGSDADQSDSQD